MLIDEINNFMIKYLLIIILSWYTLFVFPQIYNPIFNILDIIVIIIGVSLIITIIILDIDVIYTLLYYLFDYCYMINIRQHPRTTTIPDQFQRI